MAYPALHNRTKPSAPPVAKPAPPTWSAHTLTLWSGPSCARSGGLQRRDGRSGSTVGASHTYKSPRRVPDEGGHQCASGGTHAAIRRQSSAIKRDQAQSSAINVPVRMRPSVFTATHGSVWSSASRPKTALRQRSRPDARRARDGASPNRSSRSPHTTMRSPLPPAPTPSTPSPSPSPSPPPPPPSPSNTPPAPSASGKAPTAAPSVREAPLPVP